MVILYSANMLIQIATAQALTQRHLYVTIVASHLLASDTPDDGATESKAAARC